MDKVEILARLRALLDEATETLYDDDDELYPALSLAQLEIANVIAQAWYERNLLSPTKVPRAIQSLNTNASATIASGQFQFALSDILVPVIMNWSPDDIAPVNGKICVFVTEDGSFRKILENSLLSDGYFSWWDGETVFVNPPATTTAGYSFDYIKVPVDITSSVNPNIGDVSHDAIVERACWILLKDRESEQAKAHLEIYIGLLEGLKK